MSKSVKRVRQSAADLNLPVEIVQTKTSTRTALDAANYVGCEVNQIGKSILIAGAETGQLHLFLTPGARQVDLSKAADLMNEETAKADATQVRSVTGFAIGGVSPIGHVAQIPIWICSEILAFETIWVAAGTPHHLFEVEPGLLAQKIAAKPGDFLQQI